MANELDGHRSAAGRTTWHWYPGQANPPRASSKHLYDLLVDTTISLYDAGDDWLELTLDIAWTAPPKLTVNAAVEVACPCPQDHNMHQDGPFTGKFVR